MEEGFYHENPSIAASKIFPPKRYYKPWNLAKPQSYYAAILEITNSVKFKHFKLHYDHTIPAYSTCIIHKVIHPKDWGQPLHQPLSFPMHYHISPQDFNTSYTYWDYQQAWILAIAILGFSISIVSWILQTSPSGSSNGGTTMVVMLTTSKNILWLKMATYISKIIFNQLLLKGSFLPSSFSVQNFLFHGYVHGSMIIIYKTDIQYLFANSKSNGRIPL